MKPVIQEEETGCGIAAVANILGKTYPEMKRIANAMGIFATDQSLWSDATSVRRMLSACGLAPSQAEQPFTSWETLPDLALLPINFHQEGGKEFWHWVVYKREGGSAFILDSTRHRQENIRTDFEAMSPHWFIEVKTHDNLPNSG